jgi:histidinol-phosphate aminotransferase
MSINYLYKNKNPYIIPKNDKKIINLAVIQNYNDHFDINKLNSLVFINKINEYPSLDNNYNKLYNEICIYNNNTNINNILLTPGSGYALQLILKTFIDIDTKLLIPFPTYPRFCHDAELITDNITYFNFHGNIDEYNEFYNKIKINDIIYISSPNIPIGYELPISFIDIIKQYENKIFIIDEAYFEYGINLSFFNNKYKNLIITRTFSKAFGLAGIRLGYILAHENIIDKLKIGYCTKSILDISINCGLYALENKDYYINLVKNDKIIWNKYFTKFNKIIKSNNIIYKYTYGNAPFMLIYTDYPEYVYKIFLIHNYQVRNKTKDMKIGCIRILLTIDKYMKDIYDIIKKINGYYKYNKLYIDLDKTIRPNYNSKPYDGISNKLQILNKYCEINILTNNNDNYTNIQKYLFDNNIIYNNLITPFNNYYITDNEYNNGYFIRENKFYLIKFPIINYKLFNLILKYKIIHIIEYDIYEDSLELGYEKEIKIPFIGCFQELLKKDNIYNEIEYIIIGKQNLIIEKNNNDNILMLGDSLQDLNFAINNDIYFKYINNNFTLNNALDILIYKYTLR